MPATLSLARRAAWPLKKAKGRLGFHLAFSLFFMYLKSKDPGFKNPALIIPVKG